MKRLAASAVSFCFIVLVAGCSPASSASSRSSPEGGSGAYAVADFIKLGDIVYMPTNYGNKAYWPPERGEKPVRSSRPFTEEGLGRKYAEVRFTSDSNPISDSQVNNGTASYHSPGTPVYKVEGYDPSFRLAVRDRGRLTLYESVQNQGARKGSNFLDLRGKVSRIGFTSRENGTRESTIARRPRKVKALTQALANAPVKRDGVDFYYKSKGRLVFHLTDGTLVVRRYRADSRLLGSGGLLSPGIKVPERFSKAVEQSL